MKRSVILLVIILVLVSALSAQKTIIVEKPDKKVIINDGELEELIEEVDGKVVKLNLDLNLTNNENVFYSAYFGIFVDDLSFPKAQVLNYTENYGIIITGVAQNSPAWEARLQEDDIIMYINDQQIMNNKHFDKYRATLRAGDQILLTIFRNGKEQKLEMVLGTRDTKAPSVSGELNKPKKLSAGYGGGSIFFNYYQADMDDVNKILNQLGFDEQPEDGILMIGGGGKGPIGKGFFIGGYAVGYEDEQKKGITDSEGNKGGTKWLRYSTGMGGVTLDKRIPLTSKLITSLGLMLGGASHTLEVTKTDALYNWDNLGDDTNFTNYTMHRDYLVAQPKAEVMFRILSWLAIRGEVNYTYGYSPQKGWKIRGFSSEEFNVTGSPSTEYQGISYSVGPWFGF